MPERRAYSDEEIEAAIQALSDPGRMAEAEALVTQSAPQLQRILDAALAEADWFGAARDGELLSAAGRADPDERVSAMRNLLQEDTRVSMLIGVAVGYELARSLMQPTTEGND